MKITKKMSIAELCRVLEPEYHCCAAGIKQSLLDAYYGKELTDVIHTRECMVIISDELDVSIAIEEGDRKIDALKPGGAAHRNGLGDE